MRATFYILKAVLMENWYGPMRTRKRENFWGILKLFRIRMGHLRRYQVDESFQGFFIYFVLLFVLKQSVTKMASNSQSSCLSLPSAGITDMCHQVQLLFTGLKEI
jgi:hypothetical protein